MKLKFEYRIPSKKNKATAKNRIMAYAKIDDGLYTVVRYKNRTYRCTCPDNLFRYPKKCKHIKFFINFEKVRKLK